MAHTRGGKVAQYTTEQKRAALRAVCEDTVVSVPTAAILRGSSRNFEYSLVAAGEQPYEVIRAERGRVTIPSAVLRVLLHIDPVQALADLDAIEAADVARRESA